MQRQLIGNFWFHSSHREVVSSGTDKMIRAASLLLLLAASSCGQYDECFPNEVPVTAVNPCGTCEQRGYCPQEEPGCDCAPGLLRNALGQCVAPDACYQGLAPRAYGRPPVPQRQCNGPFEEFLSCGTACPPACENQTRPCPLQCVSGCFCVDGHVRDGRRRCVRPRQCERIPPAPLRPRCGPNEEYTDCGTACPPTCQLRNPLCDLQCVGGCFCRRGFVRYGGRCVPLQECPPPPRPLPPPLPTCGLNEVYSDCGSACPPTCANRQPVCTAQCVRGCTCSAGYLKKSGLCVSPQQCGNPYAAALPPARPPSSALQDCPDRRKCAAACKRRGSSTGFCIGDAFKTCACHG